MSFSPLASFDGRDVFVNWAHLQLSGSLAMRLAAKPVPSFGGLAEEHFTELDAAVLALVDHAVPQHPPAHSLILFPLEMSLLALAIPCRTTTATTWHGYSVSIL